MYVEERIYRLKVGAMAEYLTHYENEGMAIQLKYLRNMVGYYVTEIGSLNTIVHLWAYESMDQRDKRRAAMQADASWKAYSSKTRPLVETHENRVMKCAPFFIERLRKMLAAVEA